ncbi:MAG: hypothetical protein HY870_10675 [Chloroflexi bacterium]|nr:hypothetical protein [Chloroflexota bacterium]
MSNLNGPITALLAVVIVAFGGGLCLLVGGKTERARGLILVVFVANLLPGAILQKFLVRNYYAFLTAEAVLMLLYPLCLSGLILSIWLEWASPPPAWQDQDYRFKSLLSGIVLPLCAVALAVLLLPKTTDWILDIADGPTRGTGIVETARRNTKQLSGGAFVISGITYKTWDETLWRKSLNSSGLAIEYVYGPNSKIAFLPDFTTFEPASAAIPLIVLCVSCALAYLFARILLPFQNSQPSGRAHSPSRKAVEALITHVSNEKHRGSRPGWKLALIMLFPFVMVLIIILSQLFTR